MAPKQESSCANLDLVLIRAEERPLFDANTMHIFEDPDRVHAVHKQNGVARAKLDFPERGFGIAIEFDSDSSSLNEKHLLNIRDFALSRRMIVRGLDKSGFVRQQPKLK